jgi:regulator of RNase E activity RraA
MLDKDGCITMSPRPNPRQIDTLKRLGSATIHEAQGQSGAFDASLRPLDPTRRLAGVALTVDCRAGDSLVIHYALTKAVPGDVLVVDAKGFTESGPWGTCSPSRHRSEELPVWSLTAPYGTPR